VIISELLGNGTKRLEPGSEFLIHNGNLATAEESTAPCGCARPEPPQRATEVAEAPPPPPPATTPAAISAPINLPQTPPAAPAPADPATGKVQVSVDAPFVFHGDGAAPDPTITLARVRMEHLPAMPLAVDPQVPSPVPAQPANATSDVA